MVVTEGFGKVLTPGSRLRRPRSTIEAREPTRAVVENEGGRGGSMPFQRSGKIDVTGKLDDRIAGLEEKLRQLKVRQTRAEARKRALLSRRARKDDTRRKILAGAIVLAKVESGELDAKRFREWLDRALTRTEDRALFELPPLTAP